jgi:hypothetical protein
VLSNSILIISDAKFLSDDFTRAMVILLHLPSVKRFIKTSIQLSNIPQIKSMVNTLKTKRGG